MKKFLITLFLLPLALVVAIFLFALFSSRPPLTIDPQTLAGDGSTLNYCELPTLDGTGKRAAEIAKGNTPNCSYSHFPSPILADCTEPLAPEADDIRGLWIGVEGGHVGHVERVEQCGERTVVTAKGVIHDYGPNSTAGLNTDDTNGSVLFTVAEKEFCLRSSASMTWNKGILEFNVVGWGPILVRRYMEEGQLVWEYADGSTTRMNRICTLPSTEVIPTPRGPRYSFF